MHRLHGTLVSSRLDKEPEGGTVRKAACKKKKKRKKKKTQQNTSEITQECDALCLLNSKL